MGVDLFILEMAIVKKKYSCKLVCQVKHYY